MNTSYNSYYSQQLPRAYGQPINPMGPAAAGLKGRPVSSIEEARATSIDFDGSIFYFPDIANSRIYTKQINMDGTATLTMYEKREIAPPTMAPAANYVTREEFENSLKQINEIISSFAKPAEKKSPEEVPNYLF